MWTGRVQLDITRLKPERLANDLVTNDHAPLRRNPGGDDERLSIEEGSRWPLVELGGSDSGCGSLKLAWVLRCFYSQRSWHAFKQE